MNDPDAYLATEDHFLAPTPGHAGPEDESEYDTKQGYGNPAGQIVEDGLDKAVSEHAINPRQGDSSTF